MSETRVLAPATSSFRTHIPLAPTCRRSWKSRNKGKCEHVSRATNLSKAPALAKVCFPSVPVFLCSSWSCCLPAQAVGCWGQNSSFLVFSQHPVHSRWSHAACTASMLWWELRVPAGTLKPEEKLLLLPGTPLKEEQIVTYKSLVWHQAWACWGGSRLQKQPVGHHASGLHATCRLEPDLLCLMHT